MLDLVIRKTLVETIAQYDTYHWRYSLIVSTYKLCFLSIGLNWQTR